MNGSITMHTNLHKVAEVCGATKCLCRGLRSLQKQKIRPPGIEPEAGVYIAQDRTPTEWETPMLPLHHSRLDFYYKFFPEILWGAEGEALPDSSAFANGARSLDVEPTAWHVQKVDRVQKGTGRPEVKVAGEVEGVCRHQ